MEGIWPQVLEKNKAQIRTISEQLLDMIKNNEIDVSNEEAVSKFCDERQHELLVQNRPLHQEIFQHYAKENPTELSLSECVDLIEDSLKCSKLFLSALIREFMLFAEEKADEHKFSEDMDQALDRSVELMLKRSPFLAQELFNLMDNNQDGRVTEEEFLDSYATASEKVLRTHSLIKEAYAVPAPAQ
eukprot:TRINITY_DN10073_c0_g1_i1.p1 TRINITY_DN10073_c0_g1~~TRINITY_DN10073_c0_g1_i1.p1  ORF type:complete len:215 (+),score=39.34 TRINITY_DN10073_c0_g1_i1:86-646(+)